MKKSEHTKKSTHHVFTKDMQEQHTQLMNELEQEKIQFAKETQEKELDHLYEEYMKLELEILEGWQKIKTTLKKFGLESLIPFIMGEK